MVCLFSEKETMMRILVSFFVWLILFLVLLAVEWVFDLDFGWRWAGRSFVDQVLLIASFGAAMTGVIWFIWISFVAFFDESDS